MEHIIYLALGTNLGDRKANLDAAIAALPPAVQVTALSPVYRTPPWGFSEQPDFFNQVLAAVTRLEPVPLLQYLKNIEIQVGRRPTFRYGPRVVDLDILFYDELILVQPGLSIPHPRLAERAFVLLPLADLAPDLRPPGCSQSIRELLAGVDVSGIQPYLSE